MISKSAKPILDHAVADFLKSLESSQIFSATEVSPIEDQKQAFINEFEAWVQPRDPGPFASLREWPKVITDGTTAAFLDFSAKYPERKLYVLNAEYPFHKMTGAQVAAYYLDLPEGTKLILSYPFSATGSVHEDLMAILAHCEQKNIKVFIDCALLFISELKLLHFERFTCVAAVAFSLSKSFCTGRFRIGVCYTREVWAQSPSYVLNEWSYLNHLSMWIHRKLMRQFPVDYIFTKYRSPQKELCLKYGVELSDTVIFGLSKDARFAEFTRSGAVNRLCFSELLGGR